jgi:hypothetical protein
LFAEGYNMHRSLFVREISNSMALGILGVIVTFTLHFWFSYLWLEMFDLNITSYAVDAETYEYVTEQHSFDRHFFSVPQLMILAAIFSSIDLLAVMPQIPEEAYPKIA